jgi:hypothetical protein
VDQFIWASRQSAAARREVDWRCARAKWPPHLLGNGYRGEVKGVWQLGDNRRDPPRFYC